MTVFLFMCDHWLWFVAYSIAGWVYETILFRFVEGKWLRRGFLYGPFCPIYGTGAVAFWLTLQWVPRVMRAAIPNLFWSIVVEVLILFFTGGLMACTLEWFTSLALEHLFHTRWWDYFKNKGNIKGRVAPIGFIAFGCVAAGLVEVLQPGVVFVTDAIPDVVIMILAISSGAWLLLDFLLTIRKNVRKRKAEKAAKSSGS